MKKRRSDTLLFVSICIPIIMFSIYLGSILYFYHCERQYKTFIQNLSASTTYAYQSDGITVYGSPEAFALTGNIGQQSFTVTGDMVYKPYQLLSGGKQGRPRYKLPKQAPDMTIIYGDGCILRIWNTPVKNASTDDGYGILVQFQTGDGKTYSYDTDKIRFSRFSF